jgi:hypothetical protein
MMIHVRFLLAIFGLLLIQCRKENIAYYRGIATANLNGQRWTAKVHMAPNPQNDNFFDIIIDRYNSEGFLRESLFIFEFKLMPGPQKIYRADARDSIYVAGCNYFTLTDDGDVLCDAYNVSVSDTLFNHITLAKTNHPTRTVAGKFDLRLIIDQVPKCNAAAKDTLVFTNGSFFTAY